MNENLQEMFEQVSITKQAIDFTIKACLDNKIPYECIASGMFIEGIRHSITCGVSLETMQRHLQKMYSLVTTTKIEH